MGSKKVYLIYVLSFFMMAGIFTGCGDDAYIDKGYTPSQKVADTTKPTVTLTASEMVLLQIGKSANTAVVSTVTLIQLGEITVALENIVTDNLTAYHAYIDANANAFSNPATQAEVQSMINAVNAAQALDTDNDGKLNSLDTDDDNDGFTDSDEILAGTNPLVATSKPTLPDYTPSISLSKSDMQGPLNNTVLTITIKELIAHGLNNNGTEVNELRFSIVKNDKLALTLNNSMSTQNNEWELTERANLHILTYVGNEGKFKPSSTSIIVLNGVVTTPIGVSGQYDLTVTLISGSSDVVASNDRANTVIKYNNLK